MQLELVPSTLLRQLKKRLFSKPRFVTLSASEESRNLRREILRFAQNDWSTFVSGIGFAESLERLDRNN